MKKIAIICAGDFGREVAWLIEDINSINPTFEIVGFLDDDEYKIGKTINGYDCLGPISYLNTISLRDEIYAVVATQEDYRKEIVNSLPDFKNWATIIHPSVNISNSSSVGLGCIICANSNISVNSTIGNHCILNLGTTIGHDCKIADYVSLMSGTVISGHVTIKEGAYFGSNSTVVPGKTIGINSKIGAGSVVIRNVKDGVSVMGVPAKMLKI